MSSIIIAMFRGGSRIFMGGATDYVRQRTIRAQNPKCVSAGVQGSSSAFMFFYGGACCAPSGSATNVEHADQSDI